MDFLHQEIGSAKDNSKSAIHNWYKFTAGFSYKFVDEIIKAENMQNNRSAKIFDPFAGCGTTLVSSQKNKIPAVGNEGQQFMYNVIRAKLNWNIEKDVFEDYLQYIKTFIQANYKSFDTNEIHPLLLGLYKISDVKKLYLIRNCTRDIRAHKYRLFFHLALSQTLHKVAKHPIAVPYISRNKTLSNTLQAVHVFESTCRQMFADLSVYTDYRKTSKIYLHDSRIANLNIEDKECSTCITSPPYLNNLDYGEVSKVHTHFFGLTDSWNDITKKVRKNLVTGSTTHYNDSEFSLTTFKEAEFYLNNKKLGNELISTAEQIKQISKSRLGKKSFDILTLLYFSDMFEVLKEIRRVVEKKGKAYLILGDSAPYGVHIPTTEFLGKISSSVGFKEFDIHKIRSRGTKWKSLKHRHSLELTENVLLLK